MTVPYRLGVIGLGRVALLLEEDPLRAKPCSHLGGWRSLPGVALAAGCDSDPERLALARERLPGVRLYADYREMLAREGLDLLSVCAYATERCAMVEAAAAAGVRGIWCEKAMAASLAEAARMAEALRRHGTVMTVSFMRRWEERYRKVAALLAEGAIGTLQGVTVHFSGNMLHTGTHAFDLLRWWCGEVATVTAWLEHDGSGGGQSGYRFEGERCTRDYGGFALIRFDNGVTAAVHGADKEYFRFELELVGSAGLIRIGNSALELWQSAPSPRFEGFRELARQPFPPLPPGNLWHAAAANLVAAVEGREPPACGVEEGSRSLAIALAMHLSDEQGHRPVRLDEVPAGLTVPSR